MRKKKTVLLTLYILSKTVQNWKESKSVLKCYTQINKAAI